MKKTLSYISAAMLGLVALSSCNDNFERPPMVYPSCDWKANTTIADLKTNYWKSDRNYVTTPGYYSGDEPIYIRGRVISDSESGNIYNSIVIQDETGALNISVRTKDLDQTYLFGQEVVVNVTGLKLGGYNGLMQLGGEGTYNNQPSMTFMEAAVFEEHSGINGIPQTADVDTLVTTIPEVNAAKSDTPSLIKWQSQLVRFDNVTFETPGKPLAGDSNTDRAIKDADGNTINIRTSSYASFKNEACPNGTGSVVGILSYYGTNWQLLLNGTNGLIGFEPTEVEPDKPVNPGDQGTGTGAGDNPYNVAQVQAGASGSDVWVKGYIVGWVEGQVLASGAKFTTPATVQSNILLADKPGVTDVKECIPVQLPSGSDARTKLNLQANPGMLGKEVSLRGSLDKYFGTAGIKAVTEFKADGAGGNTPDTPAAPVTSLDVNFESGAIPAGWTQVQVAGNKSWYVTSFQENYYAAMTGYKGTAPFDQWLVSPAIDMSKVDSKTLSFRTQVNGYGSKTSVFEVYVLTDSDPAKATKTQLKPSLPTAPANGYSEWVQSGDIDLSAQTGTVYVAFRYAATNDANYATWCVDDIKLNAK